MTRLDDPGSRHAISGFVNGAPDWLAPELRFCSRCGDSLIHGRVDGEDRSRHHCLSCGYISYVNPRLVVSALPITDAGELVLLRRGIPPGYGAWAQPGGFLEADETAIQGAIRETREETRLHRGGLGHRRHLLTSTGGRGGRDLSRSHRWRRDGTRRRRRSRSGPSASTTSPGRAWPSTRHSGRCVTGCARYDRISTSRRWGRKGRTASRRSPAADSEGRDVAQGTDATHEHTDHEYAGGDLGPGAADRS